MASCPNFPISSPLLYLKTKGRAMHGPFREYGNLFASPNGPGQNGPVAIGERRLQH